jgi:mannose-6-phosphate isomerase-like protein (cupin superfamily)
VHTYGTPGTDFEEGSVFIDVEAGDLFVIPAAVTHKSFDRRAKDLDPMCLTGGGAHKIESDDPRSFVGALQV